MHRIDPTWHAFGGALVFLLFLVRRWASRTSIVLVFLFEWPGVILHELAHLSAGLLFRAQPCGFSILPERNGRDGGWTLGSVDFGRVTALNAVPIAFAPLILLFVAYEVFRYWYVFFPSPSLLNTLGLYAVTFTLCYESVPSIQDLRVASNWKSILLYSSIVGVFFIWKYRLI